MEPTRRGFLRMLAGAAAVAAKPTYFLPPIGGWTSPTIINPASYHTYLLPDDDLVDVRNLGWLTGPDMQVINEYAVKQMALQQAFWEYLAGPRAFIEGKR